jgi:hypothetical protein
VAQLFIKIAEQLLIALLDKFSDSLSKDMTTRPSLFLSLHYRHSCFQPVQLLQRFENNRNLQCIAPNKLISPDCKNVLAMQNDKKLDTSNWFRDSDM